MKVKDLIEQLQKIDPETEIWTYVYPDGQFGEVMPLHNSFTWVASVIVEEESYVYPNKSNIIKIWIPDDNSEEGRPSRTVLILP